MNLLKKNKYEQQVEKATFCPLVLHALVELAHELKRREIVFVLVLYIVHNFVQSKRNTKTPERDLLWAIVPQRALKQLVSKLSERKDYSYDDIIHLRTKISFALRRNSILCIGGLRTLRRREILDTSMGAMVEGLLLI